MTLPPNTKGVWRSKWGAIATYWLLQTLAIYLIVAVFFNFESAPSISTTLDALVAPRLLLLVGIYSAVIAAAQAVLLLPVRRPEMAVASNLLRLVHAAVGGVVIAGTFWLAMWPIAVLGEAVGLSRYVEEPFESPASWVLSLGVLLVSTVLLYRRSRGGLPVQLSIVICALAAAMLVAGLVGTVFTIPRLVFNDDGLNDLVMRWMAASVLLGWLVATPLVWAFVRRRGSDDALSRLSARLFLGTMIEAACIIPLDVMIRRRTNCYCGEPTYWALSACWAVGLFACGPVIFLVPLSRRRKRWYSGHCDACGYDMSGCMSAERCPECGAGWRPPRPAAPEANNPS